MAKFIDLFQKLQKLLDFSHNIEKYDSVNLPGFFKKMVRDKFSRFFKKSKNEIKKYITKLKNELSDFLEICK